MSIDTTISKEITTSRQRTFKFGVVWNFGSPLPSISVTREKLLLDVDGNAIGENQQETRLINAISIINKTYTAGGISANGMQIIALVTKILDEETTDFFPPDS